MPASSLRGLLSRAASIFHRLISVRKVCLFSGRQLADPRPIRSAEPITISIPDRDDVLVHADVLQQYFDLNTAKLLERLERGNRVVVALHGGRLVAMLWMAFDEQVMSEVGKTLVLGKEDFVTFHALTLPAWRNIGLSTALNCAAYQYASTLGRPVQWSWRSTGNPQALRVAAKLGQTRVCTIDTVWLGGVRVWYRSITGDPSRPLPEIR